MWSVRGESGPHTHGSIKGVDEKSVSVHEALVCGGQAEAQAGAHSGGGGGQTPGLGLTLGGVGGPLSPPRPPPRVLESHVTSVSQSVFAVSWRWSQERPCPRDQDLLSAPHPHPFTEQ